MPSVQMCPSISPSVTVNNLKQRVIACLNRLADRDTLSLAAAELNSIALNLSPETFPLFINCLHSIDSSAKSPVTKHSVSLLSVLSHSHSDSLAPHLSKMVSSAVSVILTPPSAPLVNQAKLTNKIKENGSNNNSQAFHDEENSLASSASKASNTEEELSLIRNQITQIEKQQSSPLHLFQKFMESSQNEMQSLERRVRGLETSLSVISTDLIVSRTITRNGNHKRNKASVYRTEKKRRPKAHFSLKLQKF